MIRVIRVICDHSPHYGQISTWIPFHFNTERTNTSISLYEISLTLGSYRTRKCQPCIPLVNITWISTITTIHNKHAYNRNQPRLSCYMMVVFSFLVVCCLLFLVLIILLFVFVVLLLCCLVVVLLCCCSDFQEKKRHDPAREDSGRLEAKSAD